MNMNALEIILEALMDKGYTEDEAGDLLKEFAEEQNNLDYIRDMFIKLISD